MGIVLGIIIGIFIGIHSPTLPEAAGNSELQGRRLEVEGLGVRAPLFSFQLTCDP